MASEWRIGRTCKVPGTIYVSRTLPRVKHKMAPWSMHSLQNVFSEHVYIIVYFDKYFQKSGGPTRIATSLSLPWLTHCFMRRGSSRFRWPVALYLPLPKSVRSDRTESGPLRPRTYSITLLSDGSFPYAIPQCIVIMSSRNAPRVPTLAECPRTDEPGVVTRELVSKDDDRAPSIHCTNIAVAGGVKYSTWFGGSKEGATDNQIW